MHIILCSSDTVTKVHSSQLTGPLITVCHLTFMELAVVFLYVCMYMCMCVFLLLDYLLYYCVLSEIFGNKIIFSWILIGNSFHHEGCIATVEGRTLLDDFMSRAIQKCGQAREEL